MSLPTHLLSLDPKSTQSILAATECPSTPPPTSSKTVTSDNNEAGNNASLRFINTATTLITYRGIRILTDPNFLHAGSHVHLGPLVTAEKRTNPALDLSQLPKIDLVLLSHYHEDHFDREVESTIRKDVPIITTPHARKCLHDDKEGAECFSRVYALNVWESAVISITDQPQTNSGAVPALRITAMPGAHVAPGVLSKANDILGGIVPPSNGWMLEMGEQESPASKHFTSFFKMYISGDTMPHDALAEIPKRYPEIDSMVVHLGGTTIPSPAIPLARVTMDAQEGIDLIRLIRPKWTVPVHGDDYDVFASGMAPFKQAVEEQHLTDGIVWVDRGEEVTWGVGRKT